METCGDRIKSIRKEAKESQKEFSYTIGISQAHLSNIEKNKDNPSNKLLRVIASEYQVRYEWLKNGEEPKTLYREGMDVRKVLAQVKEQLNQCLGYKRLHDEILRGIARIPEYFSHTSYPIAVQLELILVQSELLNAIFEMEEYLETETPKILHSPDMKEKFDEVHEVKDIYKRKINYSIDTIFNIYIGTANAQQ